MRSPLPNKLTSDAPRGRVNPRSSTSCQKRRTLKPPCLLSGVKRTSTSALRMSAFDPKRTFANVTIAIKRLAAV